MRFVYGFCNGNGRAAAVEYWQRYPLRKTSAYVRITLRESGSFQGANAECEQRRGGREVLTAVQRSPRISGATGIEETQIFIILLRDSSCHLQRGYNFCLTFCSRISLNLLGWYYQHKEFALLCTGKSKPCTSILFSTAIFS
jgi:hypothetical protein